MYKSTRAKGSYPGAGKEGDCIIIGEGANSCMSGPALVMDLRALGRYDGNDTLWFTHVKAGSEGGYSIGGRRVYMDETFPCHEGV